VQKWKGVWGASRDGGMWGVFKVVANLPRRPSRRTISKEMEQTWEEPAAERALLVKKAIRIKFL